jgi:hypothetical protein
MYFPSFGFSWTRVLDRCVCVSASYFSMIIITITVITIKHTLNSTHDLFCRGTCLCIVAQGLFHNYGAAVLHTGVFFGTLAAVYLTSRAALLLNATQPSQSSPSASSSAIVTRESTASSWSTVTSLPALLTLGALSSVCASAAAGLCSLDASTRSVFFRNPLYAALGGSSARLFVPRLLVHGVALALLDVTLWGPNG